VSPGGPKAIAGACPIIVSLRIEMEQLQQAGCGAGNFVAFADFQDQQSDFSRLSFLSEETIRPQSW
jgi:hypothetical protein